LISTRASLFFPLSLLALLDSSPLSLPSFNFSFLPSSTCILFSHCYSSLPTEFPLYPPSVTDSPAPLHHLAHLTSRPEPIFSLVLFLLYIRIPPSSPYPSSLTHTHTYTNHVSYHGARERGGGRAPLEWQVKFFYFFFSFSFLPSLVDSYLLRCSLLVARLLSPWLGSVSAHTPLLTEAWHVHPSHNSATTAPTTTNYATTDNLVCGSSSCIPFFPPL